MVSITSLHSNSKAYYVSDSESESEPEPYFKGRFVKTINDISDTDSDSDINDSFMFDSVKNLFIYLYNTVAVIYK